MREPRKVRGLAPIVAAAAGALVLTGGAAPTPAGPPGQWTRVTDADGRNIDEAGLVRGRDGTLHVAWRKRTGSLAEEIRHTRIAPGGAVGATQTASSGWNAVGNPDLVVGADGRVSVFFGALGGNASERGGIQAASADPAGNGWAKQGSRVSRDVNAAGPVGATVGRDGAALFAWPTGTHLYLHAGLSAGDGDAELGPSPRCCYYFPELATDAATGEVVLAYYSLVDGDPGILVQTVRPAVGARRLVPGSLTNGRFVLPDVRAPLVARAGGGVHVAFCTGYPVCKGVRVWRVGGGAPVAVGTGVDVEDVSLARGPDGRLWAMWQDAARRRLYAARSNRAATRFGAVVSTAPPPGTSSIWKVGGEGSLGPLDLLVSVSTSGSLASWHTQVLPGLSLACAGGRRPSCTVTDAGEPVAAAAVRVGGRTLRTNRAGKVFPRLRRGAYGVTAAKAGYAGARARLRVR